MNTIVASRAGKDLISSLASGLLTIGSRFGGALDEAATMFSNARDTGLTPREFVDNSSESEQTKYVHLPCKPSTHVLMTSCSFWYWSQNQERQQP
jgi:hypothetical protein